MDNNFDRGSFMSEWFNSPQYEKMRKELAESHDASIKQAVEWYRNLDSADKYNAVQAVLYIMCEAERTGCSHRGVMDELDIYPEGFWITELMDVHNALWSEFHKHKNDAELDREVNLLQDFTKT
jgi:hypothetical protein